MITLTGRMAVLSIATLAVLFMVSSCVAQPEQGPMLQAFMENSPCVGDAAPDFTLKNPDGEEFSLLAMAAEKPVILETGSISCPIFRNNVKHMEHLQEQLGERAQIVVVYTIEAHPQDVNSPYAQRIWVHPRNEQDGVLVDQPTTYEARVSLARKAIADLGITLPVLIDGMDNTVWQTWGKRPNATFAIDIDGSVRIKQMWTNPRELAEFLGIQAPRRAASLPTGRAANEGVEIIADIEYGKVGDYSLKLDAFLPEEGGPHPAIVNIHGGGWRNGDKASFARQGVNFAQKGIATFSINYRLSDVAPYPAAVDDCVTAMRFLRSNAERFNIDIDRIAVMGGSAGGHLVLMMAFLEPAADELDSHGNPIKNRVVCCFAQNPPTDLTQAAGIEGGRPQSALSKFMGGTYAEKPDAYREASPVTYLSPDDPPVLLLHGTADNIVSYDQSVILRDKMQEMGVPVELITIENAGHSLRNGDPATIKRAHDRMLEFIYEHLGVLPID